MELPIPSHLRRHFEPIGKSNTERMANGLLVCECANRVFIVEYVGEEVENGDRSYLKVIETGPGYFLIVKANCINCSRTLLVFDKDFHGWNGFVYTLGNRQQKRPRTRKLKCFKCNDTRHSLEVKIFSKGKEDFINETDGNLGAEKWVEGFEWIMIKTICFNCGLVCPEWVSYETM